jgi:hypothetical protein
VLGYLNAETSFIRAFGNRSLLLILLCALTRSGESIAKASGVGLSIDINPAVIVVAGPLLALLLVVALKIEADGLLLAREGVLEEATKLHRRGGSGPWLYFLFAVPTIAATFMTLQLVLKLVPYKRCDDWNWLRQLFDFSFAGGTPSTYCIGDLTQGTPWIYPPFQAYFNIGCVVGCAYLTYEIANDWRKARGGSA